MALQYLKSKSRLRRLKKIFIFHFLIILNEDVSFFLAIQEQENKDSLINKITKKSKILYIQAQKKPWLPIVYKNTLFYISLI